MRILFIIILICIVVADKVSANEWKNKIYFDFSRVQINQLLKNNLKKNKL